VQNDFNKLSVVFKGWIGLGSQKTTLLSLEWNLAVTKVLLPVMKPRLPKYDQYVDYLKLVDLSQVYSNHGPLVRLLETRYAEKLGVADESLVVLCSNATLAIQGFLQISDARTWHVPSFTFPATVHAAVQSGKGVVLEDIDPDTWMILTSSVTDPKIEGVVPVLPFGAQFVASPFDHIDHVLIDAAASIAGAGAWIKSLKATWAAVFSLHATKSFGIGEGGLIVFGSRDMAEEFRSWINFGFRGNRQAMRVGTNGKLSEVQAAVGLGVMDNWDFEKNEWLAARSLIDRVSFEHGLSPVSAIEPRAMSPYWIISHDNERFIDYIEQNAVRQGFETRKWWMSGCHAMPAFQPLNQGEASYPSTDKVGKRYLGLPFFRGISNEDLGVISDVLGEAVGVIE
jgi:dTDP-4-amino-4,6-dideoxygalactose transaminase